MRIERLRPAHAPERLAELYAAPHDPSIGVGHRERIALTFAFAGLMVPHDDRMKVADLSCGKQAGIASDLWPWGGELHLGDVAVLSADIEATAKYCGPIEGTIELIPDVDLFVCTETLEHLDVPVDVLRQIRGKARRLLLSTPINAWFDGGANEEHYWAWDREAVELLAADAGWAVEAFMELDTRPFGGWYQFGTWVLR